MRKRRIVVAVVTLACAAFAVYWFRFVAVHGMSLSPGMAAGPAHVTANASDLSKTIVTPCLDQKMVAGKNVVWCSSFQLAWNELCSLAGGPVRLSKSSHMADVLNMRSCGKSDVADESCVADAGLVEDGVVGRIRQELSRKFHSQESPNLLRRAPSTGVLAYAYLYRALPFEWAFDRFSDRLEFDGSPVQCFGMEQYSPESEVREKLSAGQVSVLDYRSQDNFIVELKTLQTGDRLILAKVTPWRTLKGTVRMVMDRIDGAVPAPMQKSADLLVPVLDFDLLADYQDLRSSIRAPGTKVDGQSIEGALQSVRFRLDETGAVVKSEAMMWASIGRGSMVFDKPFLVMLQRKGARSPYLALWVANTELLLPGQRRTPPARTPDARIGGRVSRRRATP